MSKPQRLTVIAFLSILLAPAVFENYDVQAGRLVVGNINSPYCECGVPGLPCYDETTWQLCNGEMGGGGGGSIVQEPPQEESSSGAPLALLLFTAFLIIRRFI